MNSRSSSADGRASAPSSTVQQSLLKQGRDSFSRALELFACDIGFDQPQWLTALRAGGNEQFEELAGFRNTSGFAKAEGLTASNISLLDETELMFSFELSRCAKRVRELCETELARVHLQFIALLGRQDIAEEQCPVGPEAACAALRVLIEEAGLDFEQRVELLSRSAEPLAARLLELYRSLHELFVSQGLNSSRSSLGKPYQPYSPHAGTAGTPAAAGKRGQAAPRRMPVTSMDEVADLPLDDPFGLLRGQIELQDPRSVGPGAGQSLAAQPPSSESLELVTKWLAGVEKSKSEAVPALASTDLPQQLAPRLVATLETIEQIFAAIARVEALPPLIRRLIGRLQVPVMRLALTDDTLFSDTEHPARQLIDRLGFIGMTLNANVTIEQGLMQRILEVITNLQRAQVKNRKTFAQALAMVDLLIADRNQRIATIADRAKEAADRAERREEALVFASSAVSALVQADTPPVIRNFVSRWWIQLLARIVYTHGSSHQTWVEAFEVARQLVDSARIPESPELRSRWAATLATLNKSLLRGLRALGLNEEAAQQVLSPCMEFHTALSAGKPVPEVALEPVTLPAWASVRGPLPLNVLQHPGLAPVSLGDQSVARIEPDEWLEMRGPDGEWVRVIVARAGKTDRTLLMANPEKGVVFGVTRRALADMASRRQALKLLGDEVSLLKRVSQEVLRRKRAQASGAESNG